MSEREIAVITKTTMDDLPQPTGSWQEGYQAKSRKQNMMLLGNVLAFVLIHYVVSNISYTLLGRNCTCSVLPKYFINREV